MSEPRGPTGTLLLTGSIPNRKPLERALSSAGFHLLDAADLVDALDRLDTDAVSALVLGETDHSRSTVVDRLRRSGHTLPVVALVTATSEVVTDVAAGVPPDDPESVGETITDAIDSHRFDQQRVARRRRERLIEGASERALAAGEGWADVLCHSLVAGPDYDLAWVGRRAESADRLTPVAAAGIPLDHLDRVPVGEDVATPAARALDQGTVAVDGGDADRYVLAVPVGSAPDAVLHLVARRQGVISRGERELLSSLTTALETVSDGQPTSDPDAVTVVADALSHELRNQLDIATTHLSLARERDDVTHVEHVESALDRMTSLAEEARLLARGEVDPEPVELAAVGEAAWEAVDAPDATLDVEDGMVDADPDLLSLSLENLFRNAVEHGGNEVTVTVEPLAGGYAVSDDGPGIPMEERDRVLDWGYSTDGTGVGLGIVALVAERHGWTVEVTESQSGGARFEFEVE